VTAVFLPPYTPLLNRCRFLSGLYSDAWVYGDGAAGAQLEPIAAAHRDWNATIDKERWTVSRKARVSRKSGLSMYLLLFIIVAAVIALRWFVWRERMREVVGAISAYGVHKGLTGGAERPRFSLAEALATLRTAKWELLMPAVRHPRRLGTLTDAAAVTVVYVLVVETVIHPDLRLTRDLPRVLVKSATLVGGVFVILRVAIGLTNYLVDAEIPAAISVKTHIESRLLFLLALNLFLLIVGVLDGFSAIIIAVPLVQPISAAFGIHPLNLAIIFLVNLELGYLTPPLGMNLFLASYRFERPLAVIFLSAAPFVAVLFPVLLLVTYWPQ
jgi:TRAP-type C4-dicarboxylate transport system permease large subunit